MYALWIPNFAKMRRSTKSYQLTTTLLSILLLCYMAIGISGGAYVGSSQHHNRQNNTYTNRTQHFAGPQSVAAPRFNQSWNAPQPPQPQHQQQVYPLGNNSSIASGQNAWQRPQVPGGHRPIYNVTRHNNTANWQQQPGAGGPARPVNTNPYINFFN